MNADSTLKGSCPGQPLRQPILFLATARADESRRFYEEVIGLTFVSDEPFALVFDVGGTALRIQKVSTVHEVGYTALGWLVDDIVTTLAQLADRGIRFERFDGLPQDDEGIWTSPSGTRIAWFKDPDGNLLSISQETMYASSNTHSQPRSHFSE